MRARLPAVLVLCAALAAGPAGAAELALSDPKPLPEVTFENADGEQVSLADFRGQVVVLNLWATWCAPCRDEMPSLDRLQAEHGAGDDLEVVALSLDRGNIDKIKLFFEEVGVANLDIYRDPTAQASRALLAPGLPTTVVIDREGHEIGRVLGPAEWDGEATVALLRAAMEG
jgi:thiol-disulfide isomerase/thioredoxin